MLSVKEKVAVFSPLLVFVFYVVYLAILSERSFLLRWIDGSFGFFAALVACNLLRRAIVDRRSADDGNDESPKS